MAHPSTNKSSVDSQKARTLKVLLSAARGAKDQRFGPVGDEIARYGFKPSGNGSEQFSYQNFDWEQAFGTKVAKTSLAIDTFGPYLYQTNPSRRLMAWDMAPPESVQRIALMEAYLNYIPSENNLKGNNRRAIADALAKGMGVTWHGVHPDKPAVIISSHDSIDNLFLDGSAKTMEEVKYIFRRRTKKRYELLDIYPKAKAAIMSARSSSGQSSDRDTEETANPSTGKMADTIEYYECYMRVGLRHYMGGVDHEDTGEIDNEPRKFCFCDDKLFHEGDWEVPYHVDGRWPCTFLSFKENPDSPWPISPLEAGLGWQRAINWAATLIVAKFRWSSRSLFALLEIQGVSLNEGDLEEIEQGDDPIAILKVKCPQFDVNEGMADLSRLFQKLDLSTNLEEALGVLREFEDQFERATGLHEVLLTGQGETQTRSAEAARLQSQAATHRVNDMRERVQDFAKEQARHEALAARFLIDEYDLRPIFGEQAAAWGVLMPVEKHDLGYWQKKYEDDGFDENVAAQMAAQTMRGAVTLDQWKYEADYQIEAGDSERASPEQELETLRESMNQFTPQLIGTGDPRAVAVALDIAGTLYKRLHLDEDLYQSVFALADEYRADYQRQQQQAAQAQAAQQPQAIPGPGAAGVA